MNVPVPECPACRVKMEEGYVLENTNSNQWKRIAWMEGEPQKGLLGGYRIKGVRSIPTVTYRCPSCGWLIWFAPPV